MNLFKTITEKLIRPLHCFELRTTNEFLEMVCSSVLRLTLDNELERVKLLQHYHVKERCKLVNVITRKCQRKRK